MKSAQIVSGIINGIADQYESPNVLQVLPIDKLSELTSIERINSEPYSRVFLSELVTAEALVFPSEPDNLKRSGIVNHTVIHRFDSVIERDGYFYIFPREQFERDARAGRLRFKMPPMPELKKPLDSPPPPVWEVQT
jgi:hypothetical protein